MSRKLSQPLTRESFRVALNNNDSFSLSSLYVKSDRNYFYKLLIL